MKVQMHGMAKQVSPTWVGQWLSHRITFRYSDESAFQTEDWGREFNQIVFLF